MKALKNNIMNDSIINLFLDFLLKDNFFLKKYLSEFLFKFGIFKSAIYKNQTNNSKKTLLKDLFFIVTCLRI